MVLIAAGSRHGAAPSSNANVGNFTMDHVTFSNVEQRSSTDQVKELS